MNKKVMLLVLVPLLLGGAIVYFILHPGGGGPASPGEGGKPPGGPHAAPYAPLAVLGALPDFSLVDQNGDTFGLETLLGKAWVGTFIFTSCQATCPAQTRHMALLQEQLRASPHWDRIHLVSISVDPSRDTSQVLATYAGKNKADPKHWHFLTGQVDDIRSLSIEGFKLPAGGTGAGAGQADLTHSPQLVLVDGWGLIRGYYDGTDPQTIDKLRSDMEQVAADETLRGTPRSAKAAARTAGPSSSGPSVSPGSPSQTGKALASTDWLRDWQREQRQAARMWTVEHDFQFTDRRYGSGIAFRNRIVDDAAKRYKPVHYDHGTGLAVADVDGDGLPDIYFVNQVGASQLWRNVGQGRFEDITASAGVGLAAPIKVAATFIDIDNDGDVDLYVTTVRGGNHLFLNDGKGRFNDATEGSGLGLVGHYSAAVFFDYDRDGLVDVFLCEVGQYSGDTLREVATEPASGDTGKYRYYEGFEDGFAGHLKPARSGKSLLLRNLGQAKFADVTNQVGLDPIAWTGDATPIDANQDGWPDLYILNMQGLNHYYENQGGQRFIRKDSELFPQTPWGAMGCKVFDFNNDGNMDLYVADMHSDMSVALGPDRAAEKKKSQVAWPESFLRTAGRSLFGNALYQGLGESRFQEVSDKAGVETYWPWGPSVGDLNADGYADVLVTAGMGYPFRYSINSVLLNDSGQRFLDSEFVLGVEPRRGFRTARPWFDLDASGADADHVDAKGLSGKVTVWGALSSRSSAIFDVDGDGDLDIVTLEFNAEPMLLLSNLAERKKIHYLKIALEGGMTLGDKSAPPPAKEAKSNRDGLGATVRVRCGSRTITQVNDGKSGYLSQSSLPLYFGLGEAETADGIEIVWPSGHKQTLAGPIKAGVLMRIKEE